MLHLFSVFQELFVLWVSARLKMSYLFPCDSLYPFLLLLFLLFLFTSKSEALNYCEINIILQATFIFEYSSSIPNYAACINLQDGR